MKLALNLSTQHGDLPTTETMNLQVAVLESSWQTKWHAIHCISRELHINCCEVNGAQTFRIIRQRFLYFISTVYNTVSLTQHIISRPVCHIVGFASASGSLLWSYKAPVRVIEEYMQAPALVNVRGYT